VGLGVEDLASGWSSTDLGPSLTEVILARTQADRIVLQEHCPLADSLEWQLGQRYWHERGTGAFLGDAQPVPYVINNDGSLSRRAAAVLFASLAAAAREGPLPETLFVLELGIGVGLFARFFLDAFRDLCRHHRADYYGRLCYVAGDRSPAMLTDAARHGIFANHPGRYLLRIVDALDPARHLLPDAAFAGHGPRPLRAVFLNYLLDCLPATVLEVDGDAVRQLAVRTCLARGADLSEYTRLTAEELARCVGSDDPRDQQALRAVSGLFALEYAYRPVEAARVPYRDFALAFARRHAPRFLHSHGALRSLDGLLGLLADGGFLLINDYGRTQAELADEFEHQRFSQSTSMGLNFALLRAYFGDGSRGRWVEPLEDRPGIYSRLLGRQPAHEAVVCFYEQFGKAAVDRAEEPARQARALVQAGRLEAALPCYRQALERQSGNWLLLQEVASFLAFSLRDVRGGVDLLKLALGLNPMSAELWYMLGECLLLWGRIEEASQAYRRAAGLNPSDVRPLLGLAWAHARQKDYPQALHQVAEGLALDITGQYREQLLEKQGEILARLAQRNQQEQLRQANRVSTAAPPPAAPTPPAPGPSAPWSPPPWR
jgi:tetratricopeptide (TPR) repeat protein